MTLTAEQLAAIKDCASAQELIAKAAEAGFQLDEAQAQQLLDSNEFAEVDPADISAAGGGCYKTLKDHEFKCTICNQPAAIGPGYYEYEITLGDTDVRVFKACLNCYYANKTNPSYKWISR